MHAVRLYRGSSFTLFALSRSEETQVSEYIANLQPSDQRKTVALLEHVANYGPPRNTQKSNKLTNQLFEFKPTTTDRIIWFYDGQARIVMTHAFKKEKNRTPPREIKKGEEHRRIYIKEQGG